ncbi:N5-carboxyaminoimidazole ribonucleotide synthase [Microlunatus endophyticus]|uniref:N5-carboxyaminoimidazole ribonucleotide synthase n=1 Tax=Microlunatus endophyticus TaxID=1716077 RepID=A0A917SFD5_9ACTN|nr:5-(carboxyamino)imidazole ribonucleotide synthase [Microlunatus endophyticus]GGL78736.1 N5-carboxyaminoimidazole ribonucleotide synthase [Microlunatus endophyticus]
MTYVVGIIGAGQLARMMHEASIGLGIGVKLLAEAADSSAAQVIADVRVGDYTDPATVREFASGCDVVTFDHEHVPTAILEDLEAAGVAVRPGPKALVHAQDKAVMRSRLGAMGIPCPVNRVVGSPAELISFGDETGWPVIAKTTRGGYDGKGVFKVDSPDEAEEPFASGARGPGVGILAEEFIDFRRELSALVVRSPSGQAVAYPVTETVQTDGICAETTTPAPDLSADLAVQCQQLALRIAHELEVVGILAVELMQRPDGSVVVNELAMRPHNTGHWSIDGSHTSQFENHLRAVLDLPLGDPTVRDPWTVMVNVLGGSVSDLPAALLHCFARDPKLRVQLYGKDVKPGRKVGHVTAYGHDLASVRRRARHAGNYLMGLPDENVPDGGGADG